MIYDDVMEAVQHNPQIFGALSQLSKGDFSILYHLLETQNASGTTTTGSANHHVWDIFTQYNWMIQDVSGFEATMPDFKVYKLTDTGYRAVPVILNAYFNRSA